MNLFRFGHITISKHQVFYFSKSSFAFVNLKPVIEGHVLVSSRRVVKRYSELEPDEVSDLWLTAQKVGKVVENKFNGTSLSFVIQDGPEAGQSIPHVHIHVIPRKIDDYKNNDDIYDDLASKGVDNEERKPRSPQEMSEEASSLRNLIYLNQQLPEELI